MDSDEYRKKLGRIDFVREDHLLSSDLRIEIGQDTKLLAGSERIGWRAKTLGWSSIGTAERAPWSRDHKHALSPLEAGMSALLHTLCELISADHDRGARHGRHRHLTIARIQSPMTPLLREILISHEDDGPLETAIGLVDHMRRPKEIQDDALFHATIKVWRRELRRKIACTTASKIMILFDDPEEIRQFS